MWKELIKLRSKRLSKRTVIIVAIILMILSLGAYMTMQVVNASTIEREVERGYKYFNEQNYEEAIIAFESVLEIDEKHVEARISLSNSHLALDNMEKAKEVTTEGINIVPEEPDFYLQLSALEIIDKDINEAVHTLDKGYERTKDDKISNEISKVSYQIMLMVDEEHLQVGHETEMKLVYASENQSKKKSELSAQKEGPESESDTDDELISNEEESVSTEDEEDEKEVAPKADEIAVPKNIQAPIEGDWSLAPGTYGKLLQTEGHTNHFKAIDVGQENVIATIGSITKEYKISVEEQVLNELIIEATPEETVLGKDVQIIATGIDMDDEEMDISPRWEITDGTGTLSSEDGTEVSFSPDEVGTVTITAQYKEQESSIQIVVIEKESYTLAVGKEGKGTISIDPKQDEYDEDTIVSVRANADKGWEFKQWTGDITSSSATIQVEMNQSKTITAIFVQKKDPEKVTVEKTTEKPTKEPAKEPTEKPKKTQNQTFNLKTTVVGKGDIKRSPDQKQYTKGEKVELTATPKQGWIFEKWNNHDGKSATIKVTIDKDHSYEAVFIQAGHVEGVIKNALTGAEQSNVNVILRSGKNNKKGSAVKEVKTSGNGNYKLKDIKPGVYTMELSATDFVTIYKNITIKANETLEYYEAMNPKSDEVSGSNYRAVLTWGDQPQDLDSHLVSDNYHIYYGDTVRQKDGCISEVNDECIEASLDVDARMGRGPETMTFEDLGGTYNYYIHNWSQEKSITQSDATVKLYKGNTLIQTYTVPAKGTGTRWNVFEIKNGKLNTINKIDSNN